jgi:Family of unknown function (DUF6152)
MIKNNLLVAAMSLSILALGVPATAHHSAAAQFDTTQEFVLTGVLTELHDINPHSIWHIDVKGEDGKVTAWKLEGVNPNALRRLGLSIKNDLKIGGTYAFTVAPSRDGSKYAFLKAVTVNGKKFQMVEL